MACGVMALRPVQVELRRASLVQLGVRPVKFQPKSGRRVEAAMEVPAAALVGYRSRGRARYRLAAI